MNQIARGTTPTITWTLGESIPSSFVRGYLVLVQNGKQTVVKSLSDAEIGESSISWTLTQEDTLSFSESSLVYAVCDCVNASGQRIRSNEEKFRIVKAGYEGVI